MARNNVLWGAERIRGALLKLRIRVSKRTIQKYMKRARPPGERGQTWTVFLENHADPARSGGSGRSLRRARGRPASPPGHRPYRHRRGVRRDPTPAPFCVVLRAPQVDARSSAPWLTRPPALRLTSRLPGARKHVGQSHRRCRTRASLSLPRPARPRRLPPPTDTDIASLVHRFATRTAGLLTRRLRRAASRHSTTDDSARIPDPTGAFLRRCAQSLARSITEPAGPPRPTVAFCAIEPSPCAPAMPASSSPQDRPPQSHWTGSQSKTRWIKCDQDMRAGRRCSTSASVTRDAGAKETDKEFRCSQKTPSNTRACR